MASLRNRQSQVNSVRLARNPTGPFCPEALTDLVWEYDFYHIFFLLSRFQNDNRNHSCAFFAAKPQKNGLSGGSAAGAAASRPFNPLRPTGFKKWFNFGTGSVLQYKNLQKTKLSENRKNI
jgi:hypothetical protein